MGYGFDTGTIDAKINGKVCKVTKFSRHSFSCSVQASDTVSDLTKPYIGQFGSRRKFVNKTSSFYLDNMDTYSGTYHLSLNLESSSNFGNKIGDFY